MKSLKQVIALVVIFTAAVVMGCGNQPLLTEMSTHKLIVVIKGTYESNSPAPWIMPDACGEREIPADPTSKCINYTMGHRALVQDDSVYKCDATTDANPRAFLLDVAEVRLADSQGNIHKFANYRQNFSFGLTDVSPYFSGTGFLMSNDDVPSKLYPAVLIYVRKMLMDSALKYVPESAGWSGTDLWDVFSEKQYPSFNFNKLQVHSFYDTLRLESSSLNRVFPVVVPIRDAARGMIFSDKFPVTVLEIRFVVKNFIKKYEYETYINDVFSIVHYYALSDWLQDVHKDETDIGGNLLAVARSYIPGLVGTISGTNPRSYGAHIIAIPAGADIADYTIPGTPGTVPSNPNDPYDGSPIVSPMGPRNNNPCDLSKKPSAYLGTNINQVLDYYLRMERYNYNWNQKVPSVCPNYDEYKKDWDEYKAIVGKGDENLSDAIEVNPLKENFIIPQLAVYAASGGAFTFENVSPGTYDIYIATDAPRYGYLYYDGEFELAQAGVTVTAGADSPVTIP